jgi:hypothetical protein
MLECHLYNGLVMIYKLFVMKCVVLLFSLVLRQAERASERLASRLSFFGFPFFIIMIKDLGNLPRVDQSRRGKIYIF